MERSFVFEEGRHPGERLELFEADHADVEVELLALDRHSRGRLSCGVESLAQLFEDRLLVGGVGVELEAERPHADALEAPMHHLEGRHLGGDEQHRLPGRQAMGDEVGDRLALAGTGRPLQHEALPVGGAEDRRQLARVRVEGTEGRSSPTPAGLRGGRGKDTVVATRGGHPDSSSRGDCGG